MRRSVLSLCVCLFLFAVSLRQIADVDYWTHLSEGRRIAQALAGYGEGRVLADLFGSGGNEGLYQLPLYLVHSIGGDAVVSFVVSALAAMIMIPFFWLIPRNMDSSRLWLLGVLLCSIATTSVFRFSPRPELVAYLLFSAALSIVGRWTEQPQGRDLLILIPLYALWYPLHVSWTIGLFFVGLSALLRHGPLTLYRTLVPSSGYRRKGAAVLFACVGGYLLYRASHFVILVLGNITGTGILSRVTEMRPLWEFPELACYFGATASITLSMTWGDRGGRIRRLVLWGLSLLLGFIVVRNVAFALLAQVPGAIEGLASRSLRNSWLVHHENAVRGASLIAVIALLSLSLANQDPPSGVGIVRHLIARDAAQFVKEHRLPEPLFNNWDCGGFLLWSWDGTPRTFLDGRLGSQEKIDDHFRVLEAEGIAETLQKYGFNTILLQGMYLNSGRIFPAVSWLLSNPEWKLVNASDALVFVRKTSSSRTALPYTSAWEYILAEAQRRSEWQTSADHLSYTKTVAYANMREWAAARSTLRSAIRSAPELFPFYASQLLALGIGDPQ